MFQRTFIKWLMCVTSGKETGGGGQWKVSLDGLNFYYKNVIMCYLPNKKLTIKKLTSNNTGMSTYA